jgi:hypothetical protein
MLLYKVLERRGIVCIRVPLYSGSSGFDLRPSPCVHSQTNVTLLGESKTFPRPVSFTSFLIIIRLYQEFIINISCQICVLWTTLHARNLEAYGPTLCFALRIVFRCRLETNYRDGGVSWISSVTPDTFRLNLGHGRFHSHPFQFIIF